MRAFVLTIVILNTLDLMAGFYHRYNPTEISDATRVLALCMEAAFAVWGAYVLGAEREIP
jgi:hypothetical protein